MNEPLLLRTVGTADADIVRRRDRCGQHVLHRDCETRSQLVLKSVGTHRYASDPSTTVICCAYAVDHETVQLWTPGDPVPPEFIEAADNSSWIVAAHGDHFEVGDRAPPHGGALRLAGNSARATPLHDDHGSGGRLTGAAERRG